MEYLKNKAFKALNYIKVISKQPWAQDPTFLTHLVRTLVRSRQVYGMEVYYTLTHSNLTTLQSVELKALKTALRLPKSAVTMLIYRDIDWLPLTHLVKLNCASLLTRLYATKNFSECEFYSSFSDPWFSIHKKHANIYDFTENLFKDSGLSLNNVAFSPQHRPPQRDWDPPDFDIT